LPHRRLFGRNCGRREQRGKNALLGIIPLWDFALLYMSLNFNPAPSHSKRGNAKRVGIENYHVFVFVSRSSKAPPVAVASLEPNHIPLAIFSMNAGNCTSTSRPLTCSTAVASLRTKFAG